MHRNFKLFFNIFIFLGSLSDVNSQCKKRSIERYSDPFQGSRTLLRFSSTQLDTIGYLQCQKECWLRSYCKSLMYDPVLFNCSLYQHVAGEDDFMVPPSSSIYMERSNISTQELTNDLGPCFNNTCLTPRICTELKSGSSSCRSYCLNNDYKQLDSTQNFCIKIFTSTNNYEQALIHCQNEGARLVVMNTQHKWDLVKLELQSYPDDWYWIGMLRVNDEWIWSTGEPVTFSLCLDGGLHGHIWKSPSTNGFLYDLLESTKIFYICEEIYK